MRRIRPGDMPPFVRAGISGGIVARKRIAVVSGSLVGLLVGAVASPAVAATFVSAWDSYFADGKKFENQSILIDGTDISMVGVTMQKANGTVASINRMGMRPRVYFDSGALCEAGVWRYNGTPQPSMTAYIVHECTGYVFSRGNTRALDSDGTYKTREAKRTVSNYQ